MQLLKIILSHFADALQNKEKSYCRVPLNFKAFVIYKTGGVIPLQTLVYLDKVEFDKVICLGMYSKSN